MQRPEKLHEQENDVPQLKPQLGQLHLDDQPDEERQVEQNAENVLLQREGDVVKPAPFPFLEFFLAKPFEYYNYRYNSNNNRDVKPRKTFWFTS